MKLDEMLERQGRWLFRWRSYLPLLVLACGLVALRHAHYPFHSHRLDQLWEVFCFALALTGLGIRAYAVGCAPRHTSGRNTKAQIAEVLNTTGLYSVVRHPLYLGNFLMWIGTALFPRSWAFAFLVVAVFMLYHERIIVLEERFLEARFGDVFRDWAGRTPAFVPRWKLWRPPQLAFSWRHAVKREYRGAFAAASAFLVLDIVQDRFAIGKWELDPVWLTVWLATLAVFVVVRTTGKHLRLLDVEGR